MNAFHKICVWVCFCEIFPSLPEVPVCCWKRRPGLQYPLIPNSFQIYPKGVLLNEARTLWRAVMFVHNKLIQVGFYWTLLFTFILEKEGANPKLFAQSWGHEIVLNVLVWWNVSPIQVFFISNHNKSPLYCKEPTIIKEKIQKSKLPLWASTWQH